MSALATATAHIPTMSREAIDRVRSFEALALAQPQVDIRTMHVIHGGLYARTIRIPAGVVLTGAEIKLATLLVVNGHVRVTVGDDAHEIEGYHVVAASQGRKQAFLALADTDLTMIFPTSVSTVEEAENQFTDEADQLFSRRGENVVVITGE